MSRYLVIAARGGPEAKSRLAERLDARQREALVEAMLADMLSAAAGCPAIERTYVSTPTPPLARLAARSGAVVILERGGGDLNAAFEAARRRIAAAEPQAVVTLLPGDLPWLRAEELQACFEAAGADGVAIAPAAADGGTGAVTVQARLAMTLAFGPESFCRHLAAARAAGAAPRVVEAAGLGFDLDRPRDLDAYLSLGGGGRTGEVLRRNTPREVAA